MTFFGVVIPEVIWGIFNKYQFRLKGVALLLGDDKNGWESLFLALRCVLR